MTTAPTKRTFPTMSTFEHTPQSINRDIQASDIIDFAQNFNRQFIDGYFLEFGVATGGSIREVARLQPGRTIYGFDSFLGLPESWVAGAPAGLFACSPPTDLPANVILVQGLFQDTLPKWLDVHPRAIAFVHIDCDLYSSAKCVLDNIGPRCCPGTVLVFDEINNYETYEQHEAKAFAEFLNDMKFDYKCYGRYGIDKAGFVLIG